jgi:hypothetical protein
VCTVSMEACLGLTGSPAVFMSVQERDPQLLAFSRVGDGDGLQHWRLPLEGLKIFSGLES